MNVTAFKGGFMLLVALLLIAAGVLTVALKNRSDVGGPVYSAGQVQAALRRQPAAWLGRTIRLHAEVHPLYYSCENTVGECAPLYVLTDPSCVPSPEGQKQVPRRGTENPLLSALRQFPAVGRLVPRPQPVVAQGVAWVRLEPASTSMACEHAPCYQAVFLDAAHPVALIAP